MIVEITQAQIDAMAAIRGEGYREDIETLITRNGETITIDSSTKEYRAVRAKYQKKPKSYQNQPCGYAETLSTKRSKPKQKSHDGGDNGKPDKERHYTLPPEAREKLREIFLQFRTACYQHRSLHGCTCELQTMGGCGLTSTLKNKGCLPCAMGHFEDIKIDESFHQQLNECYEEG